MSLADYGIHRSSAFDSQDPTRRMLDAILGTVAQFFDEAGCPLTKDQQAALDGARVEAGRQGRAA